MKICGIMSWGVPDTFALINTAMRCLIAGRRSRRELLTVVNSHREVRVGVISGELIVRGDLLFSFMSRNNEENYMKLHSILYCFTISQLVAIRM